MDPRSYSDEDLPEVAHPAPPQDRYDEFEYFESKTPSAAPEYQQYPAASPPLSSRSYPTSPPLSSYRSPTLRAEGTVSPDCVEPQTALKERPTSPSTTAHYSEYGSPGLQSVSEKDGEKEVYQRVYPVNTFPHQPDNSQLQPIWPQDERQHRNSKIGGLRKKWFLILAALLICTIIAICVALGVVLGGKHKSSKVPPASAPTANPDTNIGGAISPDFYSKTGAYNGSGVALASVNFGVDSSIFVYFQHYTGEIKSFLLQADGNWIDVGNVVDAGIARNSTPLSAVAFIINDVANWHIFYIDQDSYVRQRVNTNASLGEQNIWSDGPLNELNLKANDADMIGLQACYWGNFYGDTDYTFSDGFNSSNSTAASTGMHLWYANSSTSFQQYSWYNGEDHWQADNQTWTNMNGHAGVGCQTWLSGSVSYVFMVDLDNTIEIWWRDSNKTNTGPNHPTNQWVNSSIAIPNVHPSSSLGYTNYLVAQFSDETIRGYNISWAAENTTIFPAKDGGTGYDEFIIPNVEGVPGTHLSVTALAGASGGAYLNVIFQTIGDDFTMYARDDTAGSWTSAQVPVNL